MNTVALGGGQERLILPQPCDNLAFVVGYFVCFVMFCFLFPTLIGLGGRATQQPPPRSGSDWEKRVKTEL